MTKEKSLIEGLKANAGVNGYKWMIDDIRLIYAVTSRPMQQNAEATTEIRDAERNSGLISHTFEAGIETRKNLYQRLLHCSTSMSSRTEPGYCLPAVAK
jgi:hypothetical protein